MKRVIFALAALGMLSVVALRASADTVYDAAGDFSISSNPNGVWSYGTETTLGGTFTNYTAAVNQFLGAPGVVAWNNNTPDGVPAVFENQNSSAVVVVNTMTRPACTSPRGYRHI
jgi:hypothetical protein